MSDDDRIRWDARYTNDTHRRVGPNEWLTRCAWTLDGCERVLDLACGTGEDISWLLDQGFDATGIDVSPVAAERARDRDERLEIQVADLDTWEPEGTWDAVIVQHYLDRTLWPRIERAVAPGGVHIAQVITEGTPFGERFQAMRGELLRAFLHWHVLAYEERTLKDGRVVSRLAARKPQSG